MLIRRAGFKLVTTIAVLALACKRDATAPELPPIPTASGSEKTVNVGVSWPGGGQPPTLQYSAGVHPVALNSVGVGRANLDSTLTQLVAARTPAGAPVLFAIAQGKTAVTLDARSTAEAMVFLSPELATTDPMAGAPILAAIRASSAFPALEQLIAARVIANRDSALIADDSVLTTAVNRVLQSVLASVQSPRLVLLQQRLAAPEAFGASTKSGITASIARSDPTGRSIVSLRNDRHRWVAATVASSPDAQTFQLDPEASGPTYLPRVRFSAPGSVEIPLPNQPFSRVVTYGLGLSARDGSLESDADWMYSLFPISGEVILEFVVPTIEVVLGVRNLASTISRPGFGFWGGDDSPGVKWLSATGQCLAENPVGLAASSLRQALGNNPQWIKILIPVGKCAIKTFFTVDIATPILTAVGLGSAASLAAGAFLPLKVVLVIWSFTENVVRVVQALVGIQDADLRNEFLFRDPGTVPVASIVLTPGTVALNVGSTAQLQATLKDAWGVQLSNRPLTWTVANPSIASISVAGIVTALTAGRTTATVTAGARTASASLVVNDLQRFSMDGRVYDATNNGGLSGVTLVFTPTSGQSATVTTSASGSFNLQLAAGTYTASATKAGYVSVPIGELNLSSATTLEAIPMVPASTQLGSISGTVKNASTNTALLSTATVELRSGMNSTSGTPLRTLTTSTGSYAFASVAAGTYTVVAKANGFTDGTRTGISVGGTSVSNQDLFLSASGVSGQVRIVLTWGSSPSDLDAHLIGPNSDGSRFHIYYAFRGSCTASPFACLDVDVTSGRGPETVTISQSRTGAYRFYVNNYSAALNGSAPSSTTLGSSNARVDVYIGNALARTFGVPNNAGSLWTVFELNGSTIVGINEVTGGPVPSQLRSQLTERSLDLSLLLQDIAENSKRR